MAARRAGFSFGCVIVLTKHSMLYDVLTVAQNRCQLVKTQASMVYSRFTIYTKLDDSQTTMAAFHLIASVLVDATIIAGAIICSRRALSGWTKNSARIAALLCSIELFIACVMIIKSEIWPHAYPIWVLNAVMPLKIWILLVHFPSLLALGFDEVGERWGVLIPTLGQAIDLLFWSTLGGYLWSRHKSNRKERVDA